MSERRLRNCHECGRVAPILVRGMCASCLKQEHHYLARLRSYLRDHPDEPAAAVSEATQIPLRQIVRWIRDGRLETVRPSAGLGCEHCGCPVLSGRLCSVCRREVARALKQEARRLAMEQVRREREAAARQAANRERRPRREEAARERFDLR